MLTQISNIKIKNSDILMSLNTPNEKDKFILIRTEKFKYPQLLSLDFFSSRELKKAFPNQDGDWVAYARKIKYCSINCRGVISLEHTLKMFEITEIDMYEDLSEFYKSIGYNVKKKKYE